ncbi:MAG TPA: sigma-70 family RNA polymerase sigma factor [Candidatus Dormibacteraeota bacterium]
MQPESDQAPLLRVVPAPDSAAWEAVYREHVVPVYRYVFARTGNRPDAEDVTAQVFLRALPRLRLAASTGEIRGYLLTTARSVLAEHWGRHYGAAADPLDDERLTRDDRDPPAPEAGAERAHTVLGRLPERYRRVLELRFLSGMSLRETAAEMGLTLGNVKVLQFRALRKAAELDAAEPAS